MVRVTFRKQISDGNYGSETAECSMEREAKPGEDEGVVAEELLAMCRRRAMDELRSSPSLAVQRGVEYRARVPAMSHLPAVVTDEDLEPPADFDDADLDRDRMPF